MSHRATSFSILGSLLVWCGAGTTAAADPRTSVAGELLPASTEDVAVWWCSSGWKVGRDAPAPSAAGEAAQVSAARNETEAVQVVVRPSGPLKAFSVEGRPLAGPGGAVMPAGCMEILRVGYVDVTRPTDKLGAPGPWPDPLPPWRDPVDLEPGMNHPLWVRVNVPKEQPAGRYRGVIRLTSGDRVFEVPLQVEVYDFTLPDRMSCSTAFGVSPSTIFRYHNVHDLAQKREVLGKYWDSFSAHHVSPYNPAPLDPVRVTWPEAEPPPSKWAEWTGVRIVTNETRAGQGALLIYDDQPEENVTVAYRPLIRIPGEGLRLRFDYRTAVPGHRFLVTLNHYDEQGQWMSGTNNDMDFTGDGTWQAWDRIITQFPAGAVNVRLHLRATRWSDDGHDLGLVWIDNLSMIDATSGEGRVPGGDFEPAPTRTEPVIPAEALQVRFDFSDWDHAMSRAIDDYGFNSFRLNVPGLGGGTFHELHPPVLRGFGEEDPEYEILLASWSRQMEAHLAEKGWLDEAFVYWFDEPSPSQYAFVRDGFLKLKRHAPGLRRMITEQVEEGLIGGPDIWCPVSSAYRHEPAEERRRHGESFWWYVCTGPKAPHAGLFIDHPGTEMRVWLWQTWQRGIEGILVWQSTYWTSSAAYPDAPQNPYEDPMGWTSGYSTPAGTRKPWGNGDGRFLYPPEAAAAGDPPEPVLEGPVDSIRWEMLRDGIEDYEYLAMLKRWLVEHPDEPAAPQRRALEELLEVPKSITAGMTSFTHDPAPIEAHRDQVARALARLGSVHPGSVHLEAGLVDELEPLFIDSALTSRVEHMHLDVPRGAVAGVHVLIHGLEPGQDLHLVADSGGHSGLAPSWHRLIDVPVEENTGLASRTEAWDGKTNPHVIRRAPFRVFEVLAPAVSPIAVTSSVAVVRLAFEITPSMTPGAYPVDLRLASGGESRSLRLTVRVHPAVVPPSATSTFRYTNWFSIKAMAADHGLEPWSEAHWEMIGHYARLMAAGRQNTFLLPLRVMVDLDGDQRPVLRTERLRRLVNLFTRAGLTTIEGGHLAGRPGGDWSSPHLVTRPGGLRCDRPEGEAVIRGIGAQLMALIGEEGWGDRWVQHLTDEPTDTNAEAYRALARIVREVMPGIPIVDASMSDQLAESIDIWCPQVQEAQKHRAFFEERRAAGDRLWVYTCLAPGGPWLNRLLDQERLRPVYIGWAGARFELDGFLHWGLNHHVKDPFEFSVVDHPAAPGGTNRLPAGDTHVVYPGPAAPWSSTRFEAHRIGLEDFELLKVLRAQDAAACDALISTVFRAFDDYETDVPKYREARRALLRRLANVETTVP